MLTSPSFQTTGNLTPAWPIWRKLTSGGGRAVVCGWLQDKYGLSWQIVPKDIIKLISDKDPAKVDRVMQAVMDSVKLDFKKLKAAAKGK